MAGKNIISMGELLKCSAKELEGESIDDIMSICIKSLENLHSFEKHEIFSFICSTAVKTIHVTLLESKIFSLILPQIENVISQYMCTLRKEQSGSNIAIFESLSRTLKLLQLLLEYLTTVLDDCVMFDIRSLPLTVISILAQLYDFLRYKNEKTNSDPLKLQEILVAHSNELLTEFLQFLLHTDAIYLNDNVDAELNEILFFAELMKRLCKLGTTVTSIGEMAKIWKSIIHMSSENAIVLIANEKHGCLEWLADAVNFLSQSIEKTLDNVFNECNDMAANEKIIAFFLKLLLKFATQYPGRLFRGNMRFVRILMLLSRNVSSVADKETINRIVQHSTVGIMNCIHFVYGTLPFRQTLIIGALSTTDPAFLSAVLVVSCEIMKKLIANQTHLSLYVNDDYNIVKMVLKCLPRAFAVIFDNKELYRKLVSHVAAIMTICNVKLPQHYIQCEKSFVFALAQNHVYLGYFVVDVWSMLARIAPPNYCYNSLCFWSTFLNENPTISSMPSLEFIKMLAQNLFDFLPSERQQAFRIEKPIDQHLPVWTALELKRVGQNDAELTRVQNDLCDKIDEATEKCFNLPTTENCHKIVNLLLLLATMPAQHPDRLPVSVKRLWSAVMPGVLRSTDNLQLHSHLVIGLVRVSASSADIITYHHDILQKLASIDLTSTSVLIKLEILKYLAATSVQTFSADNQCTIIPLLSELFEKFVNDKDPIVRTTTFRAIAYVSQSVKYEAILVGALQSNVTVKNELKLYIKKRGGYRMTSKEHTDYLESLGVQVFSKKRRTHVHLKNMKLAGVGDKNCAAANSIEVDQQPSQLTYNTDVDLIINRIYDDASSLHELHSKNMINSEQLRSVYEVVNVLKEIR